MHNITVMAASALVSIDSGLQYFISIFEYISVSTDFVGVLAYAVSVIIYFISVLYVRLVGDLV
jgi:hypothetical protein